MTIKDYFKEWEGFDYFTFMSDDHSVYRRGNIEKSRLQDLAGSDWILREIHTLFCQRDSSLGRTPKPVVEDYLPELNPDRHKPIGCKYIDGKIVI